MGIGTTEETEKILQERLKEIEETIRRFNEESLKPDKDFKCIEDIARSAVICIHHLIGIFVITDQYERALEMTLKAEYFIKQAMMACEMNKGKSQ